MLGWLGGDLAGLDPSESLDFSDFIGHHIGVRHAVGLTLLYQHVVAGLPGNLLCLLHILSAALLPGLGHRVTLLDIPWWRGNGDLLRNLEI